jgi:hypothetical protein
VYYTTQQHALMGHIANWRLCWRELMYVTLFVCSSQAIIQWQHSSVCAPSLAAGGEQLMGLHSSTDRAWARHLLCLSSLNSSSMLAGAPSAMQLLRPLLGIIMHLADHLLVSVTGGGTCVMCSCQRSVLVSQLDLS